MHAALDRNIRVRDAGSEEFPDGPQEEGIARGDPTAAAFLEYVLQLLEDGVLQDRVYDEYERGQHAGEEGGGAFSAEEGEEGGEDASSVDVDEEEDWERAVIRVLTTQMGLVISTVALPAMAPAIMDSMVVSFLEAREERMAARSKNARVHSYPEEELSVNFLAYGGRDRSRFETGEQATESFSLHNSSGGVVCGGLGAFGLHLGAGGEGDEGVAGEMPLVFKYSVWAMEMEYVRVMERSPPPAPAKAWAMLSPCWAADVAGAATGSISAFDIVRSI
ncbi:MAG: hypothetical protein Q9194_005997 [Teloschistes cf. exilis]